MPTSSGTTKKRKPSSGKTRTRNSERVDVLIPAAEVETRVRRLGRQITRKYRGKDLILIGVLKGSFVFMSDLVRAIKLPLTCDFLRVSSYGNHTRSSGKIQFAFDTTQPISGKHVILVEDIVDTGRTIKHLMDTLRKRKPRSIRVCSLLHKPARSEVRVPIEYLGFEVPDQFVVGYGLDYAGKYRNLPYVGILRK